MKLLKGKKISEKILENLKNRIKKERLRPGLAVILVGQDKASKIYVNLKNKAAERVGIKFFLLKFKETEKETKIIQKIEELNKNKKISGIIVQLPLPKKFNTQKIINSINPEKDVDGFHPKNISRFMGYEGEIWPVLPHAIARLVKSTGMKIENKKALVLANSVRFGEVMKATLQNKGMEANYILAKNIGKNLKNVKTADILISAIGKPGLVRGDIIKKGAIIIDGGITKIDEKVLGDADFESVKKVAGYLSPVPGGVGPVTIACLLENVYIASKKQL
ncbi:MAG TPA: bifunctional 5,10-methylenetetrahydrofolate dehydrogenase/5,10-methenyltetrahydrofolate cyclohydrolase [Patescibacteria group bacterium]